jgi:hypothetical protein
MAPVETIAPEPSAAEEHAPLAPRLSDSPLEALHRPLVDHGSKEDVALGGIAYSDSPGLLEQPLQKGRHRLPLHIHPGCGAAFLILKTECGAHDSFGGGIEIGTGQHHRGVFAAELQQARLDPAAAQT